MSGADDRPGAARTASGTGLPPSLADLSRRDAEAAEAARKAAEERARIAEEEARIIAERMPKAAGAAPARRGLRLPPALRRALSVVAVLLGAALLAWPAWLNGYPLVFIDTVSYLGQTLFPEWPWDKTPAYGPFLHAFHWGWSLWLALAGQVLVLSHLLWVAQRAARGGVSPIAHVLLCAAMAGLTSLPWFAATLMPDVFAGVAPVPAAAGLARDRLSRVEAVWLTLLGAFAVAVHLSHLPTRWRWWASWRSRCAA